MGFNACWSFLRRECINLHLNHMGPDDPSNRKKIPIIFLKPNFRKLQDDSKNVSLKIGSKVPQKLGPFSHFSS